MPDAAQGSGDFRWVLRISAPAFAVIVLLQAVGVIRAVPAFVELFKSFGAELPALTQWVLKTYWIGSAVLVAVSVVSTIVLLVNPQAPQSRLKVAYAISAVTLVLAFGWSALVAAGLYQPIFALGSPV